MPPLPWYNAEPADAEHMLLLPTLDAKTFKSIWNTRQLVARPVILKLELSDDELETNAEKLLGDICRYSTQVAEVELAFRPRVDIPFPDSFWMLEQLSLEKLTISGVDISLLGSPHEALPIACPLLSELCLPSLKVSVLDLQYFAQFPRLEYLSILVDWESYLKPKDPTSKLLHVSRAFRRLEGSSIYSIEPTMVMEIYLFLLGFWPGLHSVSGFKLEHMPETIDSAPHLLDQYLRSENTQEGDVVISV
ncbi:hypothetical protein BDV93DRAFT_572880 [Ceratobasidium sp. AG-I]|nr:hypothetical protein BDV93DRAFT_572880 [Ceratobasidium sp. AG-I]